MCSSQNHSKYKRILTTTITIMAQTFRTMFFQADNITAVRAYNKTERYSPLI